MDYIFISKVATIGALYLITNFLYKNKPIKSTFFFYITAILYGFATFISFITIFFVVGFVEFLEFLGNRVYYEQIIISFGSIGLLFGLRMIYDLYYEKDELIKELKLKIQILESEKKDNIEKFN